MLAGCAEQQTPGKTTDVQERKSPCYKVQVALVPLPPISTLSSRKGFTENDQDWATDSQSNQTLACAFSQCPGGHPLVWHALQSPIFREQTSSVTFVRKKKGKHREGIGQLEVILAEDQQGLSEEMDT